MAGSPFLSMIIPFCEVREAVDLSMRCLEQIIPEYTVELILVNVEGDNGNPSVMPQLPVPTKLLVCSSFRGLAHAKNLALQASNGRFVLFVYPGIYPAPGAIRSLICTLEADGRIGAVSGCWYNLDGQIEKGYNIRRFPTFSALMLDMLLLNKLFPQNRSTRDFKMHDFDHRTGRLAEHANDSHFMARRELLLDCGGFNETYGFGWFDQIEMCRSISKQALIYFQPEAHFVSTEVAPLINRLVQAHYARYYRDELKYIEREFGPTLYHFAKLGLAAGMMIRLLFVSFLSTRTRVLILKKYRSYVRDSYITSMRPSYMSVLRMVLKDK